jgi:hypothetical protein
MLGAAGAKYAVSEVNGRTERALGPNVRLEAVDRVKLL